MLAHANHPYTDTRKIFPDEWAAYKDQTPLGTVPIWVEDGFTICQNNAILRSLGIRLGYYTEDPMIAY